MELEERRTYKNIKLKNIKRKTSRNQVDTVINKRLAMKEISRKNYLFLD